MTETQAERVSPVGLDNPMQTASGTDFVDEAQRFVGRNLPSAMTVDVEDYFQVSAFESHVERKDWPAMESRLPQSIDRILQMFDEAGVLATFFVLGCVCERQPTIIRRIADAGHEVASHGYGHERVSRKTREEFREDVVRTRKLLEDTAQAPVVGYRAPSFSIGKENLWALDVLEETGHRYSSSIVPINHDHYGLPSAPRFPYRLSHGALLEIPPSTLALFGRNWPCAGGGYFRLLPYAYSRAALRHLVERETMPAVFYFHPWEIDPEQPRIPGVSMKTKFRHYVNLDRMQRRLERLSREFAWDRMDSIFLGHGS